MTTEVASTITAGVTAITTIVTAIMAYLMAKLKQKTEAQNTKLDAIVETGDKVHVLVNSSMSAQLKLNAVSAHRIATLTKDPVDYEAAITADKLLKEHELSQKVVELKENQSGGKK